jgi:hypothetical protein
VERPFCLPAALKPLWCMPCAQHLAKEVVQSRRAVGRLYTNKAQMLSLGTQLKEQLGTRPLLFGEGFLGGRSESSG